MGLKDDVLDIKKEFQEVKNQSFAMDLLNDYKRQNKRQFVIIIILIFAFMGLLAYTIYLLNDIGVEESQQTVSQDNETKLLSEWCKMYNINYQTAWKKIKNGKSIEKALKIKL